MDLDKNESASEFLWYAIVVRIMKVMTLQVSRRIRNLLERIKSDSLKRRTKLRSGRVSHRVHRILFVSVI